MAQTVAAFLYFGITEGFSCNARADQTTYQTAYQTISVASTALEPRLLHLSAYSRFVILTHVLSFLLIASCFVITENSVSFICL